MPVKPEPYVAVVQAFYSLMGVSFIYCSECYLSAFDTSCFLLPYGSFVFIVTTIPLFYVMFLSTPLWEFPYKHLPL